MSKVVLGVDGGGTKTHCRVADLAGNVLGEGLAGPSNYQGVGAEAAAQAVQGAINQALEQAGKGLADVAHAVIGLAGVGRPEDLQVMTEALSFLNEISWELVTDARIALAGALGGEPGVNLISGTGSIAFGVTATGETVRAGGWGWILGDEGSGLDLGRRALIAALAAHDGTGPATALGPAICKAWGLERIEQVVPRIYGDLAETKNRLSGLAPLVIKVAQQGDAVAAEILRRAGHDLAVMAAAVIRKLGIDQPKVTITGGVGSHVAAVRVALVEKLAELAPEAQFIEPVAEPLAGAILMATAAAKAKGA